MYRKSIVKLTTLSCIADKSQEERTDIYEAGASQILREVAKREIKLFREHAGPDYSLAEKSSASLDAAYTKIKTSLSAARANEFESFYDEVRRLEFETADAGFIAGFLAGYRFLKEINPD